MVNREPVAELDPRYSSGTAAPTTWTETRGQLEQARVYWLATVRSDGRPHVTPLVAVWLVGRLFFCTGAHERKANNLARNAHCTVTTGCNEFDGLDVVLEGDAAMVVDEPTLRRVAAAYAAKYGPPFDFAVGEGAFVNGDGGVAQVYAVTPRTAFGFGKGEVFSQTRWRF